MQTQAAAQGLVHAVHCRVRKRASEEHAARDRHEVQALRAVEGAGEGMGKRHLAQHIHRQRDQLRQVGAHKSAEQLGDLGAGHLWLKTSLWN